MENDSVEIICFCNQYDCSVKQDKLPSELEGTEFVKFAFNFTNSSCAKNEY